MIGRVLADFSSKFNSVFTVRSPLLLLVSGGLLLACIICIIFYCILLACIICIIFYCIYFIGFYWLVVSEGIKRDHPSRIREPVYFA